MGLQGQSPPARANLSKQLLTTGLGMIPYSAGLIAGCLFFKTFTHKGFQRFYKKSVGTMVLTVTGVSQLIENILNKNYSF